MQTTKPKFRADVLREARRRKGFSQTKLAATIGAHFTSISDWECGRNAPGGRHTASLCRVLEISAEQLYGEDEEDEPDLYGDLVDQFRRIARHEAERAIHDHGEVPA